MGNWYTNTRLIIFGIAFISVCKSFIAQKDSMEVNFNGFLDTYYSYDFNVPQNNVRQNFLFHHNRHNEFSINMAMLGAEVKHTKYRAVVNLHAGTYAQDNYAAEELLLRSIQEAYVGVSLNQKNSLWLDAGVFGSNLGFESALSIDNYTLTRSLCAENSPYFLSGAKITYHPNDKWTLLAVASNGWQRIRRVQGNSLISGGTQISYAPNDKVLFNWSTFVGAETPDTARQMMYFNNFYSTLSLGDKLNLIVGFDIGLKQAAPDSSDLDYWYTPIVIAQYKLAKKINIGLRAEYFSDEQNHIISTADNEPLSLLGGSVNLDYVIRENIMWRTEVRHFQAENYSFFYDDQSIISNNNTFITTSLAVKF